jgi:chemotaxis protein MotB
MITKRFKSNTNDEGEDNVFWITMTDMLLGLMIVFMTLFILAMTGFTQNKISTQSTQSDVAKKLIKNMQTQKISAEIDPFTGQVLISDLELFEVNSYNLSSNGKLYLDKFIPIYINTIFSNKDLSDKITGVIIQGHTDSQTYAGLSSKEEQFSKNMELSLKRANSVAEYIFKTKYNKNYSDKLTKNLVVEGKSFSQPVMVNGKEDYKKSRRVELKLVVTENSIQDFLVKNK